MSWLSHLWNKENEKDRCGVGFIRLPGGHPLTPACAVHDHRYVNKEVSRKEADREFLHNALEIAKVQDTRYKRVITAAQGYLFYGAIRLFGGIVWRT